MPKRRKRSRSITVRLTDVEHAAICARINESGLSQQSYIINALLGATIASSEEIEALHQTNELLSDLDRQLRGVATNVNQLAYAENAWGISPNMDELKEIRRQVIAFRRESNELWLSIRSLISQQKHMEP